MPLNQKPTISDEKVTTDVSPKEVSTGAYIESSGDYNDDTETSIETTGSSIDDTVLDFGVSNSAKKQSLLCFI